MLSLSSPQPLSLSLSPLSFSFSLANLISQVATKKRGGGMILLEEEEENQKGEETLVAPNCLHFGFAKGERKGEPCPKCARNYSRSATGDMKPRTEAFM
jgi:hypothetical protein